MKDFEKPDKATAKQFLEDLLEIFEEIERLGAHSARRIDNQEKEPHP